MMDFASTTACIFVPCGSERFSRKWAKMSSMVRFMTKRQHNGGFQPIGAVLRRIACRLEAQRNKGRRTFGVESEGAARCPAAMDQPRGKDGLAPPRGGKDGSQPTVDRRAGCDGGDSIQNDIAACTPRHDRVGQPATPTSSAPAGWPFYSPRKWGAHLADPPPTSFLDVTDRDRRDAVVVSDKPIFPRIGEDLSGGIVGELGHAVPFPASGDMPPFAEHVGIVLGRSSNPEMIWIDAAWDVALVADVHPLRDGTIAQGPRRAVGRNHTIAEPESSVAALVDYSEPQDAAAVRLGNGELIEPCLQTVSIHRALV